MEYHFTVIQQCDEKKLEVLDFRFHSYPALVVEVKKRLTCSDACTSLLVDLKLKKKRHLLSLPSLRNKYEINMYYQNVFGAVISSILNDYD